MKNCCFLLAVAALFAACNSSRPTNEIQLQLKSFPLRCSVRAIQALDSNTVWFAGTGGQFGYTENGGRSWHIDSLQYGDSTLEFRAIAVTENAVFLLNVGSPALLFRSTDKGLSWAPVYQETHPACFYDAMAFWDAQNGIAIGDPTDRCLSVIRTTDGGNTWEKLPCTQLPAITEGEFAFAASNSNIALKGRHAWVVSGGKRSRVFHTADRGDSWEVFDTPIVEGGAMTGIFSADFYDENLGIVFGGDWQDQTRNTQNKARTTDGGKHWQLLADGQEPGYRSCVRYVPGRDGREIFAVGMPGISYSSDGGAHWRLLNQEDFYTLRIPAEGRMAWLAGKNKIAKMEW